MNDDEKLLVDRLVSKSTVAFVFALEVINRPTIHNRAENFAYNICIAWETLLKAQIVRDFGMREIYEKNSKSRTITISKCVDKIFTDYQNPVKKNLDTIIRLRNMATHLVIPEYDGLYTPFFQANVFMYVDHLKKTFGNDITKGISSQFLTIAIDLIALTDIKALNKLDKKTFSEFLYTKKSLVETAGDERAAVQFGVTLKSVKKNEDLTFKFTNDSSIATQFIEKVVDPSNTFIYRSSDLINKINLTVGLNTINSFSFLAIKHVESMEENHDLYYVHKQSGTKTYSEKAYNLIIKNINGIPNYVESCVSTYKEFRTKKK